MRKYIQLFEHQTLKIGDVFQGRQGSFFEFDAQMLSAFEQFHGEKCLYFSLIRNGIKFNQYVGTIQIGQISIEILPKIEKNTTEFEKNKWQARLIDMLRVSNIFSFDAPSNSMLALKSNSILDLYFALFVQEVEALLHFGLVKKYRQITNNTTALKGSLQFSQHIQQNIVHQERFFVRHTVYDTEHTLHFILYKTIRFLYQMNTHADLQSKIGALLLNFPAMPDIAITESTFEKLVFNQKTASYQKAIEIAKLLLLNYHPDLNQGRDHVLALMFDMNMLWERFVYASLRKYALPTLHLTAQNQFFFWQPKNGSRVSMKPDILIEANGKKAILDTKWKNLQGYNPSPEDLRQMYVYQAFYEAEKVALVYPSTEDVLPQTGHYFETNGKTISKKECSLIFIALQESNIQDWQKSIADKIVLWLAEKE